MIPSAWHASTGDKIWCSTHHSGEGIISSHFRKRLSVSHRKTTKQLHFRVSSYHPTVTRREPATRESWRRCMLDIDPQVRLRSGWEGHRASACMVRSQVSHVWLSVAAGSKSVVINSSDLLDPHLTIYIQHRHEWFACLTHLLM